MVSLRSKLNAAETSSLHKNISKSYESYSESDLEAEYESLRKRYEALGNKVAQRKILNDEWERYRKLAKEAQRDARIAREEARRQMGALDFIAKAFSSSKFHSHEEEKYDTLVKKYTSMANEVSRKIQLIETSPESEERKRIYHQLQVLRRNIRQHKDQRIRALADVQMEKVRARTTKLKRAEAKKNGEQTECPYCERSIETSSMVLDHIYPVSEGGLDTAKNTVLICFRCNSKKSDKTLRMFSRAMGFDYEAICERLDRLGKKV
jgi:5-methylcytosine-specific restriction endonuclease McrA